MWIYFLWLILIVTWKPFLGRIPIAHNTGQIVDNGPLRDQLDTYAILQGPIQDCSHMIVRFLYNHITQQNSYPILTYLLSHLLRFFLKHLLGHQLDTDQKFLAKVITERIPAICNTKVFRNLWWSASTRWSATASRTLGFRFVELVELAMSVFL